MKGEISNMSSDYSIGKARYAKNMTAVRCPSSDGYKTRAARLAEVLANGRYSHREKAYIMSERRAAKFVELYGQSYDACVITYKLEPPRILTGELQS